ncbi:glycosyl transferase group 1 [Thermovibrio ammonificans HB-1]|uniref:Glycosyl transferase group 1 n=1 Tax=Thermovibrio ammonificans (strain DSM 15698 / JCM 12110 / HB-1) TaxID=648996 RepID=E8T658_THEA1|nr:glycosyltransferase family 4 protein [Thermovibrio ammonificans]ADU96642.1 glycosyl transferase group 1 [Thermovibrio ammonificans HB-1]
MNLNLAFVHDWLVTLAGAERVLAALYELYEAPIYTLVVDKDNLKGSLFENANIHTSFIQSLPFGKRKYRLYLPLFPLAIEQFDLFDYDIIISSSHAVAKGVLTGPEQLHICYCHTPIRYAWDLYFSYMREGGLESGLRGTIAKFILHYIRLWDASTANRVDYFIANSNYVRRRIWRVYRRKAEVIYPPVDVDKFSMVSEKEDFYLTASRLVPYKKIDIIVKAFALPSLRDRKLIVIGDGPDMKKIKKMATPNVEILGYQSFEKLKYYLEKARAFIFAAEEDFGILPVEAQACGTPVIAYGKGGVLETVIEGKTGLYFYRQTPEDIAKAVAKFESIQDSFDPLEIRKHAEMFSKERFKKEFSDFISRIVEF